MSGWDGGGGALNRFLLQVGVDGSESRSQSVCDFLYVFSGTRPVTTPVSGLTVRPCFSVPGFWTGSRVSVPEPLGTFFGQIMGRCLVSVLSLVGGRSGVGRRAVGETLSGVRPSVSPVGGGRRDELSGTPVLGRTGSNRGEVIPDRGTDRTSSSDSSRVTQVRRYQLHILTNGMDFCH